KNQARRLLRLTLFVLKPSSSLARMRSGLLLTQ
ncbi:molybdopterin oxidoreductase family protein, partial [Vibrio parahaemolyticus V-223/04]